MLATESGWGGEDGRPYLARAFSVADCRPRAGRGAARLPACTTSARAPAASAGPEPGERLWVDGPARAALRRPARARRGRGRARSWSAAGSASRRWRCGAGRLAAAGIPTRVLLGFRDRERSGGTDLFRCSEMRIASEDGHQRPPRLRHRPARGPARGRRRRQRRRLRLRARRRCWRRSGCSAPSAASPPSWRWRRRWGAASEPASAAPSRSRRAATCGSASTARWSAASEIETALVKGSGGH